MRNLYPALCLLLASLPLAARATSCRIVQWGADWGTGFYRGTWAKPLAPPADVDGDGRTDDDSVSGWPFSLTTPLNPPGVLYDTDALSAVFYGGLTLYTANTPKRLMTEGHINQNHEFRYWGGVNAGGTTHPVGTRKPYPTGLYDMQGNVLVWTWGDPGASFGIKRYGGVFSHAYNGVHPSLDVKEFAGVARPYVGIRVLRRAAQSGSAGASPSP